MSRMNNRGEIEGNVGVDPEIRPLTNGRVAVLSIGIDMSYRDKDKKKVEKTEWLDVSVYAPGLVDLVEKYVKKGREIRVDYYIRKQKWDSKTRKDENDKPLTDSRLELVVTGIKLGRDPNFSGSGQQSGEGLAAQAGGADDDDSIPY
jgi:single-strand DNA-binding protein